MRLGFLLSPVIAIVLALGLAAPADAEAPVATNLTMAGQPKYAGQVTHLQIRLRHADGSPVVGGRSWSSAAGPGPGARSRPCSTNAEGRAVVDATLVPSGGQQRLPGVVRR